MKQGSGTVGLGGLRASAEGRERIEEGKEQGRKTTFVKQKVSYIPTWDFLKPCIFLLIIHKDKRKNSNIFSREFVPSNEISCIKTQ